MEFPKERMGFAPSYQGKSQDEGWLVLDIAALELEGVSKIYVDLSQVEKVKRKRMRESDALEQARKMLDF